MGERIVWQAREGGEVVAEFCWHDQAREFVAGKNASNRCNDPDSPTVYKLFKVTRRPKAKLPEKSLGTVAQDRWLAYWANAAAGTKGHDEAWGEVANAVEAEVLKRRGLK